MSRIHQVIDAIDSIGEVEIKLNYAKTLVGDLLNDYDGIDLVEMRKKISWELPRVQVLLNVIFDYCYSAKMKSTETILELEKICDDLKAEEKDTNKMTNKMVAA